MDESVRDEINEAIHNYKERESINEWKVAEEEFKKISRKVEELIFGDEERHTVKVSHQAIRYAQDIPNGWEILGNVLFGKRVKKILPCILFTWLLNMDKKLWKRLPSKISHRDIAFKDDIIAKRIAKSQSKTPTENSEINIADIFLYNISEIPNKDPELLFMMVIRFLTLFNLSICADADKSACMTLFENNYGILRHFFTYDENKDSITRAEALESIMDRLLQLKSYEKSVTEYFNNYTQTIKDKIMILDFNNVDNVENEAKELLESIKKLNFLTFRFELFKANYMLNNQLTFAANPYVQMCQLFDADFYTEELIIDNSQPDVILKEVTAKFQSIYELSVKRILPNNDCSYNFEDDYNNIFEPVVVEDCEHTPNYNKEHPYADFSQTECYRPKFIAMLSMLYSPHDIILKGTLKILSAKYNSYNTEFMLSCDKIEVDNAQMTNVQFNFKKNSNVLKNKKQKDRWYNSIFLLLANEI